MKKQAQNPTAGAAEPYWFEWQTGLLILVEMLDTDSEIDEVAFQLCGPKGWDDIGVRHRNGTTQLFQAKHSRIEDNLTFGDLITPSEDGGSSLIRSLANAWKAEKSNRGKVECTLVTNRNPGPNWREGKPPLAKFFEKVKERTAGVATIHDVCWNGEDDRYPDAWERFLDELSDLKIVEQLAFLQSLELKAGAPDLNELDVQLHEKLAILTGLPRSSVHAIFNALLAQMRIWACPTRREFEWINTEGLRYVLAGADTDPPWLGHCEVETPEPFFLSRNPVVETLSKSLLNSSVHKVDFLSSEPGAGKTSCISKLARSSAVRWQDQCVSIRFYAYRPIRPGQVDVGGDADGVCPAALWLGLLWQIRDNLRKTHLLVKFRVPVWLNGMPWKIAREHVLRLANEIGQFWGRPFVVCIDGIDHAARARRRNLPEFLDTLPAPQAIPPYIRFLFAGQPAESYPEYPFFLRQPHALVKIHSLGVLSDDDLGELWRSANPQMSSSVDSAVIRLLADKTRRRTLSAVYAVEDIRQATTLAEANAVLNLRPLQDSLNHYYDTIWSSATATLDGSHRPAAAFALLREPPSGDIMARAFPEIAKSAPEWRDILRKLRPLVRETAQGFELLHNDLRVYLESRLAEDQVALKEAASALADYYRNDGNNRLAAHRSLLSLLITAEREKDFADDFTVDWVVEAGALGIADETIPRECTAAFDAAIARKDWLLLHKVACGSLTYERLHECLTEWSRDDDPLRNRRIPVFLPVEGEPRPLELWTSGTFSELVKACDYLTENGALERASVVLTQWVGNISVETLVQAVSDIEQREHPNGDASNVISCFEQFGYLCAVYDVVITASKPQMANKNSRFFAAIETGWAKGLAGRVDRRAALRLWCSRPPHYRDAWLMAVRAAAANSRWGEVRALMHRMGQCADNLDPDDQFLFGWYAVRAKPQNFCLWSKHFLKPNYGLLQGEKSLYNPCLIAKCICYTDHLREPAQIADDLFPLLSLRGVELKNSSTVKLLLRASGIIGRMLRYYDQGDFPGVEIAVPPLTLKQYLEALWCCRPDWNNLPHEEARTPQETGRTLVEIAWECGPNYRKLLRDLALKRFDGAMLDSDGPSVFKVLLGLGEKSFLTKSVSIKAKEIIDHFHEYDPSERNGLIVNLLDFAQHLGMTQIREQLSRRLGTTRIGYGSHKDWMFQPLVCWFELLRKHSPFVWKYEGMQMLALNEIAEQQISDNLYSDKLVAEVSAAAMTCGSTDFEALFRFLVERDSKNTLWELSKAARDGFEICMREGIKMSDEAILSLTAVAIAVGRWPHQSPLQTVSMLLTAEGVPPALAQQPAWRRALNVAAGIQNMPARLIGGEPRNNTAGAPAESRSAEEILEKILHSENSSEMLQEEIATLSEVVNTQKHPKRDSLIAAALEALENSKASGRCVDFHEIGRMSRLCRHLTEPECWRLLGAMTAVTGDIRKDLYRPYWAYTAAFCAVNLVCRARSAESGHGFSLAVFHQLLGMHWTWHGIKPPQMGLSSLNTSVAWPDAARRMILSLTRTDACEPLYMAMCGLRFFADVFPEQVPALCREGLAEEQACDALLPLAQLWATSQPSSLSSALPEFRLREAEGILDDRLDAWAVGALISRIADRHPQNFLLPSTDTGPEISFPGDSQLFEVKAERNGLLRHNSFSSMANERLHRAGQVLGDMEKAFRYLTRKIRESCEPLPDFNMVPAKRLAYRGNYPRPVKLMENLVGDAIMHQCAGEEWRPAHAAVVRMVIGFGMDPWIVSAPPNAWPNKKSWLSDSDVENWFRDGASKAAEVAQTINALLKGADLSSDKILLGAILYLPTYKRDIEFRFRLIAPGVAINQNKRETPSGRTLAGWLGGWSFLATQSPKEVSVQFSGPSVNYPNSELDVTPTDLWIREWNWKPDPSNALRYLMPDGTVAAWHERWFGDGVDSRYTRRISLLSRWVAIRKCIPSHFNGLRGWTESVSEESDLLKKPE